MATTPYTSLLSPLPLPANMRQHTTPQGRQFKPMGVTFSRDLVELWIEMIAAPPPPDGHHTLYLSHLTPAFTDDYAAG
jgi:hypothetical protein